jgi:hypothetical protein
MPTPPASAGQRRARRQEIVIAALLEQPTLTDAARAAHVGEKTVRRLFKDETFMQAYRAARREIVDTALMRIQQCTTSAVVTLHRNLTCGNPVVEVMAARTILDHATRAVESGDLLARLEAVEAELQRTREAQIVEALPLHRPDPPPAAGEAAATTPQHGLVG